MTTKHTPGPWSSDPFDPTTTFSLFVWQKGTGVHIAKVVQRHAAGEAQANARLIAAAPDLLGACEALVATTDCRCLEEGLCNRCLARAAIAKAKGETS